MTVRSLLATAAVASMLAPSAIAQQPPTPSPAPAPVAQTPPLPIPPKPAEERRVAQPVNIKVEVTIAEQHGGAAPVKKTVSIVAADTMSGRVRSNASYAGGVGVPGNDVPLNVDTTPSLLSDGKIRVMIDLQYDLPGAPGTPSTDATGSPRRLSLRENVVVILENGKPLVVTQSADPVGDRQVTIEVKATVIR